MINKVARRFYAYSKRTRRWCRRLLKWLRGKGAIFSCIWLMRWHRRHRRDELARPRQFVQRAIETVLKRNAGRTVLPHIHSVDLDGQTYYLRLYSCRHAVEIIYCTASLRGSKMARQAGLRVAGICNVSVVRCRGAWHIGILEEAMAGDRAVLTTPEAGETLGRDVAAWHGIARRRCEQLGVARFQKRYRKNFAVPPRTEWLPEGWDDLVERSRKLLDNPDFLGPIVISHTDIHPGNLLLLSDGSLGWVDLESVGQRPLRYDLAVSVLMMLRRNHEAVDRFEQAYFEVRPGEAEGWRKHRLNWFRFTNTRKGYRRLCAPAPMRAAANSYTPAKRIGDGYPAFARAFAAAELQDQGQPTSQIVRAVWERGDALLHHDPRFARWRQRMDQVTRQDTDEVVVP